MLPTEVDCERCFGSSEVDRMERIAEKLKYPPVIGASASVRRVEMKRGTCFCWNPEPHEMATCDHFFNSAGSEFKEHAHEQKEFLIVFRGEMVVETEGLRHKLCVGDSLVLEPGQSHVAKFPADCEYYAITVPKTTDWEGLRSEREQPTE